MTERGIDRLLAATAAATLYPPTPALSGRVLARIAPAQPPSARPALRPATLLAALALLVLAVIAVAVAVTPSREAIADFFGMEGSVIERLPTPPPGVTPTPFPTPAPIGRLTPASLEEVAAIVGFTPALPEVDEVPRPAYVRYGRYGKEAVAVLRYGSFDLWEARLEQDANFGKGVPNEGTIVQDVLIGAAPGRWIANGPHIVYYLNEDGRTFLDGSQRTVERNTLVWRTGYAFYRIETDLRLEEALAIATTLP